MKFLFDNNLSKHLAHALSELSKVEDEAHEIVHLTDRFSPNCHDLEWIQALSREGGWAVISQDRFRRNDLEREALRKSGLIVFALGNTWAHQAHWEKAHNLVKWWPAILDQAARYQGGAAVRVPWRFSGKGKFEQIRL